MKEYVIWHANDYDAIRRKYGWYHYGKSLKELFKLFGDIVKHKELKANTPHHDYKVSYKFWHFGEPYPRAEETTTIHARHEAEAIYLLQELSLDVTQGTWEITNVEEVKE